MNHPPPDSFRDLLDPVRHPVSEEVAELLSVSRATVYVYISQGRIPGVIRLSPKRFRIATAIFAREMLGIETGGQVRNNRGARPSGGPGVTAPTSWRSANSLSIAEAARVLEVSRSRAYELAASGELPTFTHDHGRQRVKPKDLEAMAPAEHSPEPDLFGTEGSE